MTHEITQQFSFAAMFDPAVARAAVERAAQWNLPRHICHPLDRPFGGRANAALAAYDAEVDCAPISDEDLIEEDFAEPVVAAAGNDDELDEEF
jgi:hypothetical protein